MGKKITRKCELYRRSSPSTKLSPNKKSVTEQTSYDWFKWEGKSSRPMLVMFDRGSEEWSYRGMLVMFDRGSEVGCK